MPVTELDAAEVLGATKRPMRYCNQCAAMMPVKGSADRPKCVHCLDVLLHCLIVDTREQSPWHFSGDVTTEVAGLDTGDYSLRGATELVRIERKSLPDLANCCGHDRDRFWEQMRRLSAFHHKLLVIEGHEDRIWAKAYMSEIRPQSVLATLRAVQCDFGVCVIHADDARDAAKRAEWILTRVAKRKEAGLYEAP